MVHNYETFDRENGFLRGESPEYGVIAISDQEWSEIEDQEGNWEDITSTVTKKALEEGKAHSQGRSVDYETVVNTLREEGFVTGGNDADERRKAELLLEYLIDQDIYNLEGKEVVILQDLTQDADPETVHNWAKYLESAADILNDVVEEAKNKKEEIAEYYERIGHTGIDLEARRQELVNDLWDITNAETMEDLRPKGRTEEGRIIPPDGVSEEDKYEYRAKIEQLVELEDTEATIGGGETVDPERQLGKEIQVMETNIKKFRSKAADLREEAFNRNLDIGKYKSVKERATAATVEVGISQQKSASNMSANEIGDTLMSIAGREEFQPDQAQPVEEPETDTEPADVETESEQEATVGAGSYEEWVGKLADEPED